MPDIEKQPNFVIKDEEFHDALSYLNGLNLVLLTMARRFNNPNWENGITTCVVMLHRILKQMKEKGYNSKNETKDK